jgi:hypothetical protein
MGTEWGLGPFTIEQTTEDVIAILYAGVVRWKGVEREGTHPPLISRDLFDRVRAPWTHTPPEASAAGSTTTT